MAGKSFADKVRNSAKNGDAKKILSRIEQIKKKARQNKINISDNNPESKTYKQGQNRSGSGQGQVNILLPESTTKINRCILAPQQQKVYSWFLNHGFSGYFNKGLIQRDTGINHPTIRKCIAKLISLNLIQIFEYDPVSRQQEYQLNIKKNVYIIQGSGQGQVSSIRSRLNQGQVDTNINSYKLVSKFFKKLTNYIESSEFWRGQGLTSQKCQEWVNEFDFLKNNPEFLITQLMFAEHTDAVLNPKKTPVHVFYGCLKNGGLTRPKNFEFPKERAARIQQEELDRQKKIIEIQEKLIEQERQLADKMAFLEFLKDKENINFLLTKIEKKFTSSTTKNSIRLYKKTGKIDSKLYAALKRKYKSDLIP